MSRLHKRFDELTVGDFEGMTIGEIREEIELARRFKQERNRVETDCDPILIAKYNRQHRLN